MEQEVKANSGDCETLIKCDSGWIGVELNC